MLIVIVWPYAEQTGRFLYPILPLLFIYGAVGLGVVAKLLVRFKYHNQIPPFGLILILVIVLPTMAFFQTRARFETPIADMDFSRVMLFYNYPNLNKAKELALYHEHLRQDMELIKSSTPAESTIMWYTPNYITLLANRNAVRYPRQTEPRAFFQAVKNSGADYVFAARLNPRYTSEKFNGMMIAQVFQNFTTVVWSRKSPLKDELLSELLKIDHLKLDRMLNHSQD